MLIYPQELKIDKHTDIFIKYYKDIQYKEFRSWDNVPTFKSIYSEAKRSSLINYEWHIYWV